jgi:hypothetical protein
MLLTLSSRRVGKVYSVECLDPPRHYVDGSGTQGNDKTKAFYMIFSNVSCEKLDRPLKI